MTKLSTLRTRPRYQKPPIIERAEWDRAAHARIRASGTTANAAHKRQWELALQYNKLMNLIPGPPEAGLLRGKNLRADWVQTIMYHPDLRDVAPEGGAAYMLSAMKGLEYLMRGVDEREGKQVSLGDLGNLLAPMASRGISPQAYHFSLFTPFINGFKDVSQEETNLSLAQAMARSQVRAPFSTMFTESLRFHDAPQVHPKLRIVACMWLPPHLRSSFSVPLTDAQVEEADFGRLNDLLRLTVLDPDHAMGLWSKHVSADRYVQFSQAGIEASDMHRLDAMPDSWRSSWMGES